MPYRWGCAQCGELHNYNPTACRNCSASIFEPISESVVEAESYERSGTQAMDPDQITVMGTTPDPEFASGPDIAPDGSLITESEDQEKPIHASNSYRRYVVWVVLAVLLVVGILLLAVTRGIV